MSFSSAAAFRWLLVSEKEPVRASSRKSATWRTRMGARQLYSMAVVRPAGAAEDTVPSNRVARGGRRRLPPGAARWRSACPNPKLPRTRGAAAGASADPQSAVTDKVSAKGNLTLGWCHRKGIKKGNGDDEASICWSGRAQAERLSGLS